MAVVEKIKGVLNDDSVILWVVGFTGVCVLVGLGKLEPKAVEMFIMAIVGRAATSKKGAE